MTARQRDLEERKKDGYVGYATGVGTKPKRRLKCFGWLYDRR